MSQRLEGKAAIVTGGGAGIAEAVCLRLAADGASVLLVDLDAEAGEDTARAIGAQGGTAVFVQGDVTAAADASRVVERCVEEFGRVDVLANVVGGSKPMHSVVDLPEEDWRELLDFNLTSTFLMSKFAIPKIAEAGGGAIVNVSSGAGVSGMPLNPGYCAAKGGVINLTRNIALDYAADGIRCNCVAPGAIAVRPREARAESMAAREIEYPQARTIEEVEALHALGRMGTPEEIAEVVAFLASEHSSFITGATLVADGGLTIQVLA